jgi:FtsP/CotA-like multicopper oxidase with cupredoxin domain
MKSRPRSGAGTWLTVITVALLATTLPAHAEILGITGPNFTLTASEGYISTPDGNSIYCWGFANGAGTMQYPGPTLIVNEGATVSVTLNNTLTVPVSIVFPGQGPVATSNGVAGAITREAAPPPGVSTVTYTFVASKPGTYTYHSGTRTDLQVEMGLFGALIVRPSGFDSTPAGPGIAVPNPNRRAYGSSGSTYDREYLFLLSEMDPDIHPLVEFGNLAAVDTTTRFPNNWFINGRCGPDTMAEANASYLPNQPYSCMPQMHPGERVLLRLIGGGLDLHPFHHHGNNTRMIAKDGRLLESVPGVSGPDLAPSDFTITVAPGETYDAIFTWTGEKIGWDVYGHAPGDPLQPGEYAPDHGKPFPTAMPSIEVLTFGMMASGSPFLGASGALPPGEGGFNPYGGFYYMWHSHNEKEIVNNNVFPGGMLTMAAVQPPWADIME